jgi:hypothetical protein
METPDLDQAKDRASLSVEPLKSNILQESVVAVAVALVATLAFYFSIKPVHQTFDYTSQIASALLNGHLGLESRPASRLNELVPLDGRFYSVFPLGAVLSVLPMAALQKAGWIHGFPARAVTALIAGSCVFFFFRLSTLEGIFVSRRVLLSLFPIFATWFWCNVGFGGAWQLALGFAVLGQVGALYFTLVRPYPLLAGPFFALAVGNRTELILTLPVYLCFLSEPIARDDRSLRARVWQWLRENWRAFTDFMLAPVALGILTAAYNFARFGSFFDFGYTRIPNLLNEPWYKHGLFSLYAIPWNAHKMLFAGFRDQSTFPYLRPDAFGASIFLSSPFLFLLFREGGKYKRVCWIVIAVLTFLLWIHGNPGGWQFSYRYAIVLLPWMFLIVAGNGPVKLSAIEVSLFIISVTINAIATWQFLWTNQIQP